MSRASATTETMMCRTAHSPITMPSSPSITFHTRIPPDSSAAKALMNEKMPDTMIWMPNRTARTSTVGPGQATAHIPAATMRTPKNSSQPQCRPTRPSWSPMSLDRGVVIWASQLPRCTGHMSHDQLGGSRCPCPAGQRFANPAVRPGSAASTRAGVARVRPGTVTGATGPPGARMWGRTMCMRGIAMNSSPTPEGRGSVSGAPNLPAGFTDTFTSRYVDTGELRLHAVTGGDGPPLLLVHGWPQFWYQFRLIMPGLARDFSVVAVDQRGIGLSDKPQSGYDTATLANDLVALMDALGHQRFALYGTDVGMPIAYALAADHRDRLDRLIVSEAPLPGISPSPPLFLPPQLNARLWHLAFNQLETVNEQLVTGREDIFFGAEFDASAGTKKLPGDVVRYYIDTLKDPDHLRGSFGFYRAIPTTSAQNEKRKTRRLTLPVLAIGGAESSGEGPGNTMKLTADDVQTVVLAGSGHWVAEQAPEELLASMTAFLAPYRERAAAAPNR